MKHSASKGDKKKKKDVAAQMAVLESELEARHEQELKAFSEQDTLQAINVSLHRVLFFVILYVI